MPPIPTK